MYLHSHLARLHPSPALDKYLLCCITAAIVCQLAESGGPEKTRKNIRKWKGCHCCCCRPILFAMILCCQQSEEECLQPAQDLLRRFFYIFWLSPIKQANKGGIIYAFEEVQGKLLLLQLHCVFLKNIPFIRTNFCSSIGCKRKGIINNNANKSKIKTNSNPTLYLY